MIELYHNALVALTRGDQGWAWCSQASLFLLHSLSWIVYYIFRLLARLASLPLTLLIIFLKFKPSSLLLFLQAFVVFMLYAFAYISQWNLQGMVSLTIQHVWKAKALGNILNLALATYFQVVSRLLSIMYTTFKHTTRGESIAKSISLYGLTFKFKAINTLNPHIKTRKISKMLFWASYKQIIFPIKLHLWGNSLSIIF